MSTEPVLPPSVVIRAERPDTADAVDLIKELDATLQPLYPAESCHGFSVEKLVAQAVAFFVLRAEGVAAGCGGIKLVGTEYGEIKRMYVRPSYQGRGFGRLLLEHLTDYAHDRGVGVLRLETGIYQTAAIALYERMGFDRIGPFAEYFDDPMSIFFEKRIM